MTESLQFIISLIQSLFDKVNSFGFNFFGTTVGLYDVFVAMICVSMVLTLFWKGGRG